MIESVKKSLPVFKYNNYQNKRKHNSICRICKIEFPFEEIENGICYSCQERMRKRIVTKGHIDFGA